MEMFLGETSEFWIRVRAAMQKARIRTPDELADRLGVSPPIYHVEEDGDRWIVIAQQRGQVGGAVIGWGRTREGAERIAAAIRTCELA